MVKAVKKPSELSREGVFDFPEGMNVLYERVYMKKDKNTPKRPFAVRQVHGPSAHDDLVILAFDAVDAHRQWFNYHSLQEQAHRYRCRVIYLEPNEKELISKAITCDFPRVDGEQTMEEKAEEHYRDIHSALGESAEPETVGA